MLPVDRQAEKIVAAAFVPIIEPNELLQRAIIYHNKKRSEKYFTDEYSMNFIPSDVDLILGGEPDEIVEGRNGELRESYTGLLRRICVNYIRHVEINYTKILRECGNDRFSDRKYRHVKAKVLQKIGRLYPWLQKTCKRLEKRISKKSNKKLIEEESVESMQEKTYADVFE